MSSLKSKMQNSIEHYTHSVATKRNLLQLLSVKGQYKTMTPERFEAYLLKNIDRLEAELEALNKKQNKEGE